MTVIWHLNQKVIMCLFQLFSKQVNFKIHGPKQLYSIIKNFLLIKEFVPTGGLIITATLNIILVITNNLGQLWYKP